MDFVEAFSLTRIKHNTSTLIYNFKQIEHKMVRECSNRLKKYILRCPETEVPTQERLVSIFLESLLNKKLHAALYRSKHKTLAACIKEAIELVDNCDEYREGMTTSTGETDSSKGTPSNIIV